MAIKYTPIYLNNFAGMLTTDMLIGSTNISIDTPLPALGRVQCYYLTVFKRTGVEEFGWEVVRVIAVSDNGKDLTIERGVEGTVESDFLEGESVEIRLTAERVNDLNTEMHKLKTARFLDL